jgi:hypothetical protein
MKVIAAISTAILLLPTFVIAQPINTNEGDAEKWQEIEENQKKKRNKPNRN